MESNSHPLRLYIEPINKSLPNPLESQSYTMISFYLFHTIYNPNELIVQNVNASIK